MPPKRAAIEGAKPAEECMLLIGKHNNVIKWKEQMQTIVTELYGIIGMFFTTNVRFDLPRTSYRDYPDSSESEESSSDSESDEEKDGEEAVSAEVAAARNAARAAKLVATAARDEARKEARRLMREKSKAKLKEGDYITRKRDLKTQRENERTVFPMMWKRMSPASQSRVKEEEEYKNAYLTLDCVLLWTLIRRTHLTHIFGDTDPMKEVNMQEQESKYASLRQGEREYISVFKTRFDEQVSANDGVGVPAISDSKRALEFLLKLDQNRYRRMLAQMRNDALRCVVDAYPKTLVAAYRIASQWTNEESTKPAGGTGTDSAYVTGAKDSEKKSVKPGGKFKKKIVDPLTIHCFVCGEVGHYARECTLRKSPTDKVNLTVDEPVDDVEEDQQDEWDVALVTTNDMCLFSRYDVLLDNEASLNIFSNADLLTSVRKATKPVKVSGIQLGGGVAVDQEGDFGELGKVYYSRAASANILSFASQVDSGACIRYDHVNDVFTLQPVNSDKLYKFSRKDIPGSEGRFYCCDWRYVEAEIAMVTTVAENARAFTKREIEQAKKARELLARMGFPTVEQAITILHAGSNFDVTARDFQIADAIWGKDIASMRGKTVKRATSVADIVVKARMIQQEQVLAIDIMFIDKIATLIGVATPLGLTLATSLNTADLNKASRAADTIKKAIMYFIGVLASQNFKTAVIMSDGEGAMAPILTELNTRGVEVDISGAGGHVARIERRIRVVKERVRAHVAYHLPFTLSSVGISMCVLYCVSRLNYEPAGVREWGPSPREAFIGRKPDGKRDFRCSFGDYAQCTVPNTDNTMRGRTEDCVVMLPLGNRTGTVRMLSLASGKLVNRDQFQILPMPASVIQRLNELALKDGRVRGKGELSQGPTSYDIDSTARLGLPETIEANINDGVDPAIVLRDNTYSPQLADSVIENVADSTEPAQNGHPDADTNFADDDIPVFDVQPNKKGATMDEIITGFGDMSVKFEVDVGPSACPEVSEQMNEEVRGVPQRDSGEELGLCKPKKVPALVPPQLTKADGRANIMDYFRNGRNNTALLSRVYCDDNDWEHRVFNISVNEALRTRGKDAETVIEKELGQMISKKVWTPVNLRSLSGEERSRIIRSSMFLKEKFLASGEYEKMKARLVAGGDQQDKGLYDDLSAPTVGTSSVFTILSIAAHEGRKAAVIDISGAFLNADMNTGIAVHMRLDATMTRMMTKLAPEYSKFADHKGCVVVQLDKALYGCVESAALWYENLRASFLNLGYKPNQYDICVFNRHDEAGNQCTVAVHVDDLLITSVSAEMIEHLAHGLIVRYGDITRHNGPVMNYLGMVFDITLAGTATVTMGGYVDDMLKERGTIGGARTPATEGLFDVRNDAGLVQETDRVDFHRCVAKMLYLAKRARPDCLTAVSFLATRVNKCTFDDLMKLERLMKYVRATRERGLVFRPGNKGIEVSVLIDAAYGVHPDGRSHTGSCVIIGDRGAVHCKSAKQQIVTKSSTEAELVALSDSANQALHVRNFITGQGHACGPVTIYQDNMSCMALIDRGRSAAERTRHIAIKYFWLKERVENGEARIKHLGTKEMYANVLTKPLQGKQFKVERLGLTGWADDLLD